MEAKVIKMGIFSCQVCVPKEWTDEQVIELAEKKFPCGTTNGWQIRKEGNELLQGQPEQNPCSVRVGFVHIMLDA